MTAAINMTPRDSGRISAGGDPVIVVAAGIGRTFACGLKAVTLALSVGCIMAVSATAEDNVKPEAIAGRWLEAPAGGECPPEVCKTRTFDIVKCGDSWCGIEVGEGGKCGRLTIRLTATQDPKDMRPFVGTYSAVDGTEPYVVGASFLIAKSERQLIVYGHTGSVFRPFQRSYPLEINLSRVGDAQCKADPRTS